ncbi:DUF2971 domain-containing protein [Photobacterium damselae]|uniref:DUF2971 domain-containing protein n=1 Tax=Photobacterium damselae TaxID=38293 RepID=UPI001EDD6141|nr:DUF2971 domain-containing protein [Photobacterium damselae]EJN6960582.1 DUF2971 domain-containing protein [Photobacterium damselae]MCG3845647.1 DUF2971 domain-containing protein [Photobacterium damselae]
MTFYKYTTTSTAEIILQNKSLRWSSPLLFNDIEECQFTPFTQEQFIQAYNTYTNILEQCASGCLLFDFSRFSENTRLLINAVKMCKEKGVDTPYLTNELLMNHGEMHRDYINKGLINCFRILCVTTAYDNNLMWAYYADQHYGCVLELESVFIDPPRKLKEGEVRYHENINPLSNPLDMFLYGETPEVHDLMVKDIIFSKRTNWKHEEEYRFMFSENFGQITSKIDLQNNKFEIVSKFQSDKSYTDVPISKESIKSIIFGARTNSDDIEKIVSTVIENKFNCEFYQMKMKSGSLVKEPLSIPVV